MKATLRLSHRATHPEYLAVERSSAHRHELIDGVIVAMTGGSDEHNGSIAFLSRFQSIGEPAQSIP